MNPIHTQELHTMRVHVFASEADRLAAQAEGLVSQDDLVLTPDTGESLFEDMQAATDAANAAIARAEELSQEFEDALSGGILQGPPGPQGTPGTDGADGENGATFTPSLSAEGILSWTNDQGLQNPAAVSIRGPQGPTGPQGAPAVLSTHTGTLLFGQWVNSVQGVDIPEITPESLVIVSPTPESFSVYSAAGTRAFTLVEGAVGFTYDTLPTADMTVNIMILNGGEQT